MSRRLLGFPERVRRAVKPESASQKTARDRWDKIQQSCPHSQIRQEGWSFIVTLSKVSESAPQCPECDLLLRAIEEFKPGWKDKGHGDTQWIDIGVKESGCPAVILFEATTHPGPMTKILGFFQIFVSSEGTILPFLVLHILFIYYLQCFVR